jgi:AcrR family transcriptional regulator
MVSNLVSKGPKRSAVADTLLAPVARAPRQMRGLVRVDGILQAAAELIVKNGLAGVTMHELARHAQTSIGSLYHFFPDRESVLDVLHERHQAAFQALTQQLDDIPSEVWQQSSTAAVIERLLKPYVDYLQQHADALPLIFSRPMQDVDTNFIHTIRAVLEARLPRTEPTWLDVYASMLHALGTGTMWVRLQVDPSDIDTYLREIPRALTAYLANIEAAAQP